MKRGAILSDKLQGLRYYSLKAHATVHELKGMWEMASWNSYLDEQQSRFTDELLEFLRIPSISAQPEAAPDVRRAGEWVAARMRAAGIEAVRMMETGGHPVVYGEWLHAPGKPTIMIYGHFDTQPADPLELWTSPPFEP